MSGPKNREAPSSRSSAGGGAVTHHDQRLRVIRAVLLHEGPHTRAELRVRFPALALGSINHAVATLRAKRKVGVEDGVLFAVLPR